MVACTDPVATNTIPSALEENGVPRGFSREAFWWAVRPWRDSTLSSSCPADQAQSWGDSEQLLGWSAWAGSVA